MAFITDPSLEPHMNPTRIDDRLHAALFGVALSLLLCLLVSVGMGGSFGRTDHSLSAALAANVASSTGQRMARNTAAPVPASLAQAPVAEAAGGSNDRAPLLLLALAPAAQ